MAIDTAIKRRAAFNFCGLPFLNNVLPDPDNNIEKTDRAVVLGIYDITTAIGGVSAMGAIMHYMWDHSDSETSED